VFERVLMAVDGSAHSQRALEAGRALALTAGSELRLLQVVERGYGRKLSPVDLSDRTWAKEAVDRTVAELREAGIEASGSCRCALRGHTANEIRDEAARFRASVIIMGTRGLSDLAGATLGSVSHQVLHLGFLPVLLVHRDDAPISFHSILLATDGSQGAEGALDAAGQLARSVDGEVHVLHCAEYEVVRGGGYDLELFEDAMGIVKRAVADLHRRGAKATGDVHRCQRGTVAREIVGQATARGAALIAMGTRGRSDLGSLVLGSTLHRVLHLAGVPVLAVPQATGS